VPLGYRPIATDVIRRARDSIRHVGAPPAVITVKMVICAIVGCSNTFKQVQGISFYRLPAVISHQGERAKNLARSGKISG